MKLINESHSTWWDAAGGLIELSEQKPKTVAFSVRMRRLMRVVLDCRKEIADARKTLVEKYGKKDSSGTLVDVGEDKIALTDGKAFETEMRLLMEQKVELNVEPLTTDELEREGIVPSPSVAYRLGPLLVESLVSTDGVKESARLPQES